MTTEDPKYKPEAVETEQKQKTDINRYMNIGKPVELAFGTYQVKEFSAYKLISIVAECAEAFTELGSGKTPLQVIAAVGRDVELQTQVSKILAICCNADDYKPFMEISPTDFIKVLKTIKEVVNFEELKQSFLELELHKYLTIAPTSTETSEN